MIKVLHFVSTPAIWSGVMSVIMNYYRHIDRSRVQFDFLCFSRCSSEESYEREIEELGGKVYFVHKPGYSVKTWKQIALFFNEHSGEYTWFHNHEVYLSIFLFPLVHYFGIKNIIAHCHATKYSDKKLAALRNRVLCVPLKFMRYKRFACSKAAGAFLFGEQAVQNGYVHILYNAIEPVLFQYNKATRSKIRKALGICDTTFIIGHVGRFVPQKNHVFILKVFQAFCLRYPDTKLLLVGDGPLMNSIMNLGKELGIHEKIIYAGYQKNAADYYQAMDVFIMPSLYEGLPCACIEAQAGGLPCVISDRISNEVCINSNISRLSLEKTDIKKWSYEIQKYRDEQRPSREICAQAVKSQGYAIEDASYKLENYYWSNKK